MISESILALFIWLFINPSCESPPSQDSQTNIQVESPKREFRAVWVVTLDNKDFPSQPGLSPRTQEAELKKMLDYHQERGINAIIFQVRPSADAFYQSNFEPWSEWMMGRQGQAPPQGYDPLQFLIEECHRRNMELHAWFNPYRVVYSTAVSDVSAQRLLQEHSNWIVTYGKHRQLNPGLPQVRNYIMKVMMDVVKRYDIDGVQFDDYFYPYKIWKKEFPDQNAYRTYGRNFTNKDNWRRNNVDKLIKMVHDSLNKHKPWVKFGVSPMGVWRNRRDDHRGSATLAGQPSYDYLYADVRKWLQEGWIDYIAPQLYWGIGHPRADYYTLTRWWGENHFERHLYIGQAFYKISDDGKYSWNRAEEIPNQLRLNRSNPHIKGSIFFRAKHIMQNPKGVSDSLKQSFYAHPALRPRMPWKDAIAPNPPRKLRKILTRRFITLKWEEPLAAKDGELAHSYIVYRFPKGIKANKDDPRYIVSIQKENTWVEKIDDQHKDLGYTYLVTAIDRLQNESEAMHLSLEL